MKYLIGSLRERFPVNRVVAYLTPLLATLAGLVSAWLAENLPFIADNLSESALTAIFLAGAAAALTAAYQWLAGWQKHEARVAAATNMPLELHDIEAGSTTLADAPADGPEDLERAQADKPQGKRKGNR